ncbi:hypothetical protein SLEP1_g45332 [Rubroshorea leprosula]|uniref:Uncharacterized protein n=1 Tax=Rubroshorea leprosula TaxID=152421 RepID=A0AAV5LJI0_9ROSI|nr:hypothetical protein SLEP1_g45332 [Rubroshorea leprosula]
MGCFFFVGEARRGLQQAGVQRRRIGGAECRKHSKVQQGAAPGAARRRLGCSRAQAQVQQARERSRA